MWWISHYKIRRWPSLFGILFAASSMALSSVVLLIYLLAWVYANPLTQMKSMALHTSLGLLGLSVGVMAVAGFGDRRRQIWLPVLIGIAGMMAAALISQAAETWELVYLPQLLQSFDSFDTNVHWRLLPPKAIFITGVLASILLAIVMWLVERLDSYVKQLRVTNRRLMREVEAHQQTEQSLHLIQSQLEEQMDELQTLHSIKDDFLNTVSHELRTPMTNIKMALKMIDLSTRRWEEEHPDLPVSKLSPQFNRYFQILQQECDRELHLINDLLDLQRLEAGMQSVSLESIDLSTWLPNVVKPFYDRAISRQQELTVELAPDLAAVVADPMHLDRILSELLNNACKYTPPGDRIWLTGMPLNGRFLTLCVGNSGVSLPDEALPKLFDRFYRVPGSDRWKQGGTGLGLALVKHLAAVMGGQVRVEHQAQQLLVFLDLPMGSAPGKNA